MTTRIVLLGVMTLDTNCCYADCRVCFNVMLSVVMLSVIVLRAIKLNVIFLSAMAPGGVGTERDKEERQAILIYIRKMFYNIWPKATKLTRADLHCVVIVAVVCVGVGVCAVRRNEEVGFKKRFCF
jgi:hypothetical protein